MISLLLTPSLFGPGISICCLYAIGFLVRHLLGSQFNEIWIPPLEMKTFSYQRPWSSAYIQISMQVFFRTLSFRLASRIRTTWYDRNDGNEYVPRERNGTELPFCALWARRCRKFEPNFNQAKPTRVFLTFDFRLKLQIAHRFTRYVTSLRRMP